jgi:hypothetical protein
MLDRRGKNLSDCDMLQASRHRREVVFLPVFEDPCLDAASDAYSWEEIDFSEGA